MSIWQGNIEQLPAVCSHYVPSATRLELRVYDLWPYLFFQTYAISQTMQGGHASFIHVARYINQLPTMIIHLPHYAHRTGTDPSQLQTTHSPWDYWYEEAEECNMRWQSQADQTWLSSHSISSLFQHAWQCSLKQCIALLCNMKICNCAP